MAVIPLRSCLFGQTNLPRQNWPDIRRAFAIAHTACLRYFFQMLFDCDSNAAGRAKGMLIVFFHDKLNNYLF